MGLYPESKGLVLASVLVCGILDGYALVSLKLLTHTKPVNLL